MKSHYPVLLAFVIVISILTAIKPLSSHIVPINTSVQLWYWLCSGNATIQNNLVFKLTQRNYVLHNMTFCLIGNASNITLTGLSDGKSSIECFKNGNSSSTIGFGFVNITSITLENLNFIRCGATITKAVVTSFNDTHPHLGYKQKALLVFNHCHNITIEQVNIDYYIGYAIMMLNPLGSSLINQTLVNNGFGASNCYDSSMFACSGSGIAVVFKDTKQTSHNMAPAKMILAQSQFYDNINIIPNIPPLTLIKQGICTLPIFGAGLLTVLFNQSFEARFMSQGKVHSGFSSGTVAGGILVIFYNGMMNSQLLLKDIELISGELDLSSNQTGGAYIAVFSVKCGECLINKSLISNPISFENLLLLHCGDSVSSIFDNSPLKYGGCFYLNIFDNCNLQKLIGIVFKNVTFSYSIASKSGSCLYAFVNNNSKDNILLTLDNIEARLTYHLASRSHALYNTIACLTFINWNNVTISGNNNFHDNRSPVIAAYNSNICLTGQHMFTKNTGCNGPAVSLYTSFLILQEPLTATFLNNNASLYGGAIYADNTVIPGHRRCAIQISTNKTNLQNLNITLKFERNTAGLAGNSIYATPLYNCSFLYSQDDFKPVNFDWKLIAHFDEPNSTNNKLKQISSQPVKICSCHLNPTKNEKISTHCSTLFDIAHIINTYPGKTIVTSLCAVDDFGNIVYSPAVFSIINDYFKGRLSQNFLYLKPEQTLVPLSGSNCTQINYKVFNKIDEFKHGVLNIATPGNSPSWLAEVYVHPCPMGFMLIGGECLCNSFITDISLTTICNITTTTISISSGQWLGHTFFDNKSDLGFASVCPPGNCKTDTLLINVTDPLSICKSSKAGVLCGQCHHDLSVVFGGTECRPCSHLWLITIVAYALSGLLLVVIMLVLHLTISEGPLAGIVIAMNITSVSTIDYLDNNNWFIYTARVFVSLMNLNLGFPLCLYNGMTPAVKTGIQFIYPVYLWILVIGFIIFSQYSTQISNKTASYSVQVLASLIHLSFSKVLITCIDIIAYVSVRTARDRTVIVWYGDGNVNYLSSPQHIALFTVAMTSLLLYIIPYIIFVTLGRYCMRWRYVNKYLRPFLEAFQGPYKQGQGYWYGVRMITVVYVHLMWAVFRGYNVNLMLFMQIISIIILCFVQTSIKPFRCSILNHIDSFCITMLIVQLLSAIVFGDRYYWLSYIIASYNYIVVILFFGVIVYQCWEKCKCKFRKEKSHDCGRVVIPSDEEDDEMRQALIAFQH